MPVEALKCPSCGALLRSEDATKCEYCGAILVYSIPQQVYTTRIGKKCLKCETMNEAGRWFCKNCFAIFRNELPSEELEKLEGVQKRVRFLQDNARSAISPEILEMFEPHEYVHYVYHSGDTTYNEIITNKRIIHYRFHKGFLGMGKRKEFWEAPYKDIVAFDEIEKSGWSEWAESYESKHSLVIITYTGKRMITIDTSVQGNLETYLLLLEKQKMLGKDM